MILHMENSQKENKPVKFASNFLCSVRGEFGMKVICSKCFNANIHRHTGTFSAKECQIHNAVKQAPGLERDGQ